MGVKAAERQLSERIRDFFHAHLKTVAPAISPNDESNFAYLLARVEADRKGDWKKKHAFELTRCTSKSSVTSWVKFREGLLQSGDERFH